MSLAWEGTPALPLNEEDYFDYDLESIDEDPPETPAQREYRLWNEHVEDYDFTWEELYQED